MGIEGKSTEMSGLRREMGFLGAVNLILNVMIGSGIFISPQGALYHAGSVGLCLIIWVLSGLISLLGALCFAELGCLIQLSGAEYIYLLEAFKSQDKFWGPVPAFVCAWVYVMILRPAEIAIIILTFAEYTIEPFSGVLGLSQFCADHKTHVIKLFAILALGVITFINCKSVRLYLKINNIFGFCKVAACAIVILSGMYYLFQGNTENLQTGFEGTNFRFSAIALSFYSGLWAFDGWTSAATVSEEIKSPQKNIYRSILAAVPLVTLLYVFMNLAYMTVLSKIEMINSSAVGVSFAEKALGKLGFLIPLGVALSTFGCALSIQFAVTRLCFVASREGHMPEPFSYIHAIRATPIPSVILQGILSLFFLLAGNIDALIEFASFLIWFFYGCACIALLLLRKTHSHIPRSYRVPTIIPIFITFVSLFLVITPMIAYPDVKYLSALGFIFSGFIVYIPFVYYKKRPQIADKISYLIQMLFVVVPHNDKNN